MLTMRVKRLIIWDFSIIFLQLMISRSCSGARILAIFPVTAISHFGYDNAVMKSLNDAGHEITMVTSLPQIAAKVNYTKIIDISKGINFSSKPKPFNHFRQMKAIEIISNSLPNYLRVCGKVFEHEEYQEILNSKDITYDVIFVETLYLYKCYLPIAQKLNIPVIGVTPEKSWYLADRAVGNVRHPANIPYEHTTTWRCNAIYERFRNIWYSLVAEYANYFYSGHALKQFYKDHEKQLKPYAGFLDIEPVLIFANTHNTFLPRPLNPNVIEVGGIHIPLAKELPQNFKKFIEEAKHGVIIFSLGSLVRADSLPNGTVAAFLNVFRNIPQRVIWKFEEQIENLPRNVMLSKWIPQRDILEHPNVIAFISHCGQSSVYEAIHTATPVITCPLTFDQPANAAILEHLGVAVQLNIDLVSEENVAMALNSIINDTKYYDNMQKLSIAFKDRPLTPQQSVVYWTEYIIRHKGAPNLKTPSSELNWFQYFLLDVLCIALTVFIIIVCFLYRCVKTLRCAEIMCRYFCKNKLE